MGGNRGTHELQINFKTSAELYIQQVWHVKRTYDLIFCISSLQRKMKRRLQFNS